MSWLIQFAKAIPIVAVTALLVVLIPVLAGVNSGKATGLAAVIGVAAEGLLCVGILNVALGLILWGLLVVWLR